MTERPPAAPERGASSVEYALLVALIAGVIFLVVGIFGQAVASLFEIPWP